MAAGGRDVAGDTTLAKRIIPLNLLMVLLLCGIDNTYSGLGRRLIEPTIVVNSMFGRFKNEQAKQCI